MCVQVVPKHLIASEGVEPLRNLTEGLLQCACRWKVADRSPTEDISGVGVV